MWLSLCYDIRFPELYRALSKQAVEILVIPSAFTNITGEAHWEILVRARAIENLCYVIASNQTGVHANGRASYGHSMIVDPWGKVLASLKTEEGVMVANIDLTYLAKIRTRFPALQHRKIF
jgi:predicted amidohydrolase